MCKVLGGFETDSLRPAEICRIFYKIIFEKFLQTSFENSMYFESNSHSLEKTRKYGILSNFKLNP